MKIVNIHKTTWAIVMHSLEKMWILIMLKGTKYQSFSVSQEDTILDKPQG